MPCFPHQNMGLQPVQGHRDIGYFDNLKAGSGNVTSSMTFATESNNQSFIVSLSKMQTTVTLGWQNGAVWLPPRRSPAQHPLHGKGLQRAADRAGPRCASWCCSSPTSDLLVAEKLPGLAKAQHLPILLAPWGLKIEALIQHY